jgi:shikimate kinase
VDADSSAGRHLVLVGLMGAGKTTVGQRCAELLQRPFVDTDELVTAAAGVSFDDLWAAEG